MIQAVWCLWARATAVGRGLSAPRASMSSQGMTSRPGFWCRSPGSMMTTKGAWRICVAACITLVARRALDTMMAAASQSVRTWSRSATVWVV